MNLLEDKVARKRFFGVVVWFALLVIFVPQWYSSPANFVPQDLKAISSQAHEKKVLFSEVYKLPESVDKNIEISSAIEAAKEVAAVDQALKGSSATPNDSEKNALEHLVVTSPKPIKADEDVTRPVKNDTLQETPSLTTPQGKWMVLLAGFKRASDAKNMLEKVSKLGYKATIKYYDKSQIHSVRVIGLDSQAKAETTKDKLDKIFNLKDSIIRQNK